MLFNVMGKPLSVELSCMQAGLVIFVVFGQKIVCQFMKDTRAMFTYNF